MFRQSIILVPPVGSVPQLTPVAVGNAAVGVPATAGVLEGGVEDGDATQPGMGLHCGSVEPAGSTHT